MPELVIAALVDEATNVPEAVAADLRERGAGWRAMQIALFVKWHHLDEYGTIDAFPIGQLDARPLELGAADHVRRQVRETLAGEADLIARALKAQGFDTPAGGVTELPVEMDLQRRLTRQLSEPQPRVSEVTPPPRTIRGEADESGSGA